MAGIRNEDRAVVLEHRVTDEQLLRVWACGAAAGVTTMLTESGAPADLASQVGIGTSTKMLFHIEMDPLVRLDRLAHLQRHCQTVRDEPEPPAPVRVSRRELLAGWTWVHRRMLWAVLLLVIAAGLAAPPALRGVFNGASLLALLVLAASAVLAWADPARRGGGR